MDRFLRGPVEARALAGAMELGVINHLVARSWSDRATLAAAFRIDAAGLDLLCNLLCAGGVCEESPDGIRLSAAFRRALDFRDLLETKLEFAALALPDIMLGLTALVTDPEQFRRRSQVCRLFDYGRCYDTSPESEAQTRRWMRLTTALTRYEAGACMARHPFDRHRRLLDVGGNSGEFALQICRRFPEMRATVFDLPLVCRIGREHVGREPEGTRIDFVSGNALADPLPGEFDLVTFKSVLHDWPAREAGELLRRASRSLEAGGTLLIFERGPLEIGSGPMPYSQLPLLVFSRSLRPPDLYVGQFEQMGFRDVAVEWVDLEMPFFLVTGVKGS